MGGGDPFLTLHREMNRLFDDVLRGGGSAAGGGQGPSAPTGLLAPHMDVSETEKEIRIQVELPGVNENDVELALNDDVLTIRAEKKQERKEEREGVHISERSFGTFQRAIRLPYQIDAEKVQARFENGVLHVTVPKTPEQERTKKIQIQGGRPQQTTIEHNKAEGGQANKGKAA
jgi:HSP20 family protein